MDYAAALLAKLPGTSPRRSKDLRRLIETLESYIQDDQIEQITKAYEFGAHAHAGQDPHIGRALYLSSGRCRAVTGRNAPRSTDDRSRHSSRRRRRH